MNLTTNILKIAFLLCLPVFCFAQNQAVELTLESIYKDNNFAGERFGAMQWLPDGKSYSVVEKSDNGQTINKIDIVSGQKSMLVKPGQLILEGESKPITIESYTFSNDMKDLIIFTNTKRVWRYNTIGDYYHLNLQTSVLSKIAPGAKSSSLQFAKLSPEGGKIAYVYEHNIYVQDLSNNQIKQLTFDGSTDLINGTFDWAYEEEFNCRDGFRWSPDGEKIAFWQIDASGIGVFNMINYTDSIYSKLIPLQYPKVGTTISAAKIGTVTIADGTTKWMDIPGDLRDNYLPYMDWADNSSDIIVQQIPRKQTHNHVYLCDISSGKASNIMTDGTDKHWIDVNDNIIWFNKGKEFLWLSEENGWKHIYLVSRDGAKKTLITNGNYDVMNINYIDNVKGYVYFTSSLESPNMRFLYRIKTDGKSKPEKLAPQFTSGTHSFNIAPGALYAIHQYSSATTPPRWDMFDLQKNKTIRNLVNNDKLVEKISALHINMQEFFRTEIEPGVLLDCYMIKPTDFDPAKKYPVIFHVYGEPWGTTVTDSWGGTGMLFHQYLAKNGYIVMSIENRGTPVPRGVDFRKYLYKAIGIKSTNDQANAVKKILDSYPFIDAGRIGIWGWSGGGSMTLNLMLKHPDLYKTGVAVASVPDQLLYNAFYQERFMLHPKDNPEGYFEGSPVNFAQNLKGNLLVIHGTGDDNVHYQGAEVLFNAFIKHNKQFDMFLYPNRAHGIYEGEGTTLHLRQLIFNYFKNNL